MPSDVCCCLDGKSLIIKTKNINLAGGDVDEQTSQQDTSARRGVRGEQGSFFQHPGDPHYSTEWVQEDTLGRACEQSSMGARCWDFLHQAVSFLISHLVAPRVVKLAAILRSTQRRGVCGGAEELGAGVLRLFFRCKIRSGLS